MSEIRFSNEPVGIHKEAETAVSPVPNRKIKMNKKYFWFPVAIALVIVGLKYGSGLLNLSKSENDKYYAVFLDNNQVYFGKMGSKDNNEMILTRVYYLSLSGNDNAATQTTPASFQLLKLGNEIHGPTDFLYLNMSHVVFYEELRPDSVVVKKIQENKIKNQ